MDHTVFVIGTLSLLSTPGPTNTLLATAGAGNGFRRSLPLLAAELSGYLLAILVLRTAVGPIVAAVPAFGVALRVVVVLYLIHLALLLWRHGESELAAAGPITFRRVFVTTLLNPKAIIFAFTLLPPAAATDTAGFMPWLAALALQIFIVGGVWIAAGASLGRGFRGVVPAKLGYRASAAALVLLAGVISAHTFSMT
jgi:threonine/homoserine/homoserine lactone efflux protein